MCKMGFLKGPLLILVVCLSVSVTVVTGLQCYTCNYYHLDSSDAAVREALSAFISASNENCKGMVNITPQTCPSDGSGVVYMCAKVDFKVELSVAGKDAKMDVLSRVCIPQPTASSDICEAADDDDKALYSSLGTITSLEGTACRCSTDLCNGQPSITAEKFCWLTALLLVVLACQL